MFHYTITPTLEMRKSPDLKAEIVSQCLFSEEVQIIEESDHWVHIKTVIDNYTGWAKKEGFFSRNSPYISKSDQFLITNRLATHLYEQPDTIYGPIMTVPFESRLLTQININQADRWLAIELPDGRKGYVQRGDVSYEQRKLNLKTVGDFSRFFLGLPYTWGGRSSFGYDCSGYVQMLLRQIGVFLPRDSKDQYSAPDFLDCSIEELTLGDLIFFGFSREKIQHVGLCLGDGQFIHTSAVTENQPYVRISHVNDSAWNGKGYYPFAAGRKLQILI